MPGPADFSIWSHSKDLIRGGKIITADHSSLVSGKWVGYFLDDREENEEEQEKWPMDIFFAVKSSTQFFGFGKDDVDVFTIDDGQITGDKCEFIKVYDTHLVTYSGTIGPEGTTMTGQWYLTDDPEYEGDFFISLDPL